jgi:dipeptidyl aminopeptidase/acylaminoacyl peptidase
MHFPFALCRRAALALLFTLPLGAAAAADATHAPAQAAVTPPTLASFFDHSSFAGAQLSPNGRYLAARTRGPGGRLALVAIDLGTNTMKVLASYGNADIGRVLWLSDERLAFDLTDREAAPGERYLGAGLFAVNRDGSNLRQLAERRRDSITGMPGAAARKVLPPRASMLGDGGAHDSEWMYVTMPDVDGNGQVTNVNLLRLNTLTGQTVSVMRPGYVHAWMLDHQGKPRLAIGHEHDLTTLYYLDPANDKWRTLATYQSFTRGQDAISPLGFGPDGTLYVSARGGKDTLSLYAFDYQTGKIKPEALVEIKDHDFDGSLVANQTGLLGVRFQSDTLDTAWFSPAMKTMQDKIDKLLPSTVNIVSVAEAPDAPWALVRSYSDTQPAIFMLYNLQTGQLNKVGEARPDIDSRRMAPQQVLHYTARDGLDIPALLTVPAGTPKGAKLPLVVLVHGGPYVRGSLWGWNPQSQFLASRGYAVLEPGYRGTTGFGSKHFMAGWKQWGLKMQDDIADGARWAIAQGIADPKRICIAGASYGGYATLMGLVKDPDLYRCGVEWAGVTDLQLLHDGHWSFKSDMSDDYREYGMPELIGDPVKDAAQFAATSPLQQAARITQPLLLAYGGVDRRVPMYHGRKFYDAVTKTNKQVEWIEYQDEAHGWSLPKNQIDFWGRVEKFLDNNIGKDAVIQ